MNIRDDVAEVQKAAAHSNAKGLPREEAVATVRANLESARVESGQNAREASEAGKIPAEALPSGGHGIASGTSRYDAVNPPHYRRGPVIKVDIGENITKGISTFERVIHCIEVMRHIKDPRLATAFKYLWRVAFGGKKEPGDPRPQAEIDSRDIKSAIWYLQDWLDNPT